MACGIFLSHMQHLLLQHAPSGCVAGLQSMWASVLAAPGPSCSEACGILAPGPRIEPVASALQGRF